jgi:6-phosphogluconolactonase
MVTSNLSRQGLTGSVEILPTPQALIQRSLELVLQQIDAAIAQRGVCTVVLSGGSTPQPLYQQLAQQPLPWSKLHIFWGDERYVAADHPDSNQRMARQAWLDQVAIPASHIHPMHTTSPSPEIAAQIHGAELKQVLTDLDAISASGLPQFDIVLLGMGDDGHTASLFPHTPALDIQDLPDAQLSQSPWVTVGQKDNQPRLTLTVPVLNQARNVLFILAGASKQPALIEVWSPDGDDRQYPSRMIRPQGQLWWLLDQAAYPPAR